MSIYFYHRNLKVMFKNNLTDKESDIEYFKDIGSKLIFEGFNNNKNLKQQIKIYTDYVKFIQKKKLYKINEDERDYYIACILALWKLDVYDPFDATSPLYISPRKKKKSVSN